MGNYTNRPNNMEVQSCWLNNKCFCEAVQIIGVSLSEPHTSEMALQTCVCIYVCLLAAIYRQF